jgi:hypothetical protein
MLKNILYIHGFNSSPNSEKAVQTKAYFAKLNSAIQFHCPQLKNTPEQAIAQLSDIILSDQQNSWAVMGSSLGGYFATYFAEQYQFPAVLINPAIQPYLLMKDYLGPQQNPYTNEKFEIEEKFIEQLKQIEQKTLLCAKNYFVMVQTGDEVLDYRLAVEKYASANLEVQQGGDHRFVNYQAMLPNIAKFLQLI